MCVCVQERKREGGRKREREREGGGGVWSLGERHIYYYPVRTCIPCTSTEAHTSTLPFMSIYGIQKHIHVHHSVLHTHTHTHTRKYMCKTYPLGDSPGRESISEERRGYHT